MSIESACVDAGARRLGADVVAVVEDDGAALAQLEQRAHVAHHRRERERLELARVAGAQLGGLLERDAHGQVARAQVVRGREVGRDVGGDAAREHALEELGGVDGDGDRERAVRVERGVERLVDLLADEVDRRRPRGGRAPSPRRPRRSARRRSSIRVIATGCAAPMPPSPALTTSRPRSVPPKCSRATCAKVS